MKYLFIILLLSGAIFGWYDPKSEPSDLAPTLEPNVILSCTSNKVMSQSELTSLLKTPPAKRLQIEPLFQKYVELFELRAEQQNTPLKITNLIIKLNPELPLGTSGLCIRYPHDALTPEIHIRSPDWDKLDAYGREALIFHELAHCVLRRQQHRKEFNNDAPLSLMTESLFNSEIVQANYDHYMYELFHENDLSPYLTLTNPIAERKAAAEVVVNAEEEPQADFDPETGLMDCNSLFTDDPKLDQCYEDEDEFWRKKELETDVQS